MGQAHAVGLQAADKLLVWVTWLHGHAHILQAGHNAVDWIFDFVGKHSRKLTKPGTLFQLLILDANLFALAAIAQY